MGGGIGMGNTCKPLAVSFQCMTKSTTNKKKKRYKRDKEDSQLSGFSSRKVVVSVTKRKKYCSFGFVNLSYLRNTQVVVLLRGQVDT